MWTNPRKNSDGFARRFGKRPCLKKSALTGGDLLNLPMFNS
jgi:hypothetical protein